MEGIKLEAFKEKARGSFVRNVYEKPVSSQTICILQSSKMLMVELKADIFSQARSYFGFIVVFAQKKCKEHSSQWQGEDKSRLGLLISFPQSRESSAIIWVSAIQSHVSRWQHAGRDTFADKRMAAADLYTSAEHWTCSCWMPCSADGQQKAIIVKVLCKFGLASVSAPASSCHFFRS